MTQEQVAELCVGRFPLSKTRGQIMTGLREVLAQLSCTGLNGEVWVNGSFVTEKFDPEDVDFTIRLYGPAVDAAPDTTMQVVIWASSDLKATHHVDGYFWAEWPATHSLFTLGEETRLYWSKWYGTSRGSQPKGIVVIRLGAGMP